MCEKAVFLKSEGQFHSKIDNFFISVKLWQKLFYIAIKNIRDNVDSDAKRNRFPQKRVQNNPYLRINMQKNWIFASISII